MNQLNIAIVVAGLTVATSFVAARAQAAGVPFEQTPSKVQASIKKQLPTARPGELKIEEHFRPNGKKLFEVDYETAAADVELEIAQGGAVKKRRDRIPLSAVPKPVIDASKKEKKEKTGAQTAYGHRIVDDDGTLYELVYDNQEGKLKLRYQADGSLIRRYQEMNVAALPKNVAETARKELGGQKAERAARVTKSDGVSYRVESPAGPAELELKISPEGKLLEREGPGANVKKAAAAATAGPPVAPKPPAAARRDDY